jgi:multiple sugar transport system permease protein
LLQRWIQKPRTLRQTEEMWFYILVSPFFIGFVVFTLYPILASLYYSFTRYDVLTPPVWVGLKNYIEMATDDLFLKSLKVTTVYTIGSVTLGLLCSLGLSMLLNNRVPGVNLFRTIFYLPTIVSGVALATLWMWIFNADFGILNYIIFQVTGEKGPIWLGSEQWVIPALIMVSVWGIGGTMVIFLAGLQGVPTELYEAAELDGAGGGRKFLNVTLPMLSPVIFFNALTMMIGSFQVFTTAMVMTDGGPNYASYFFVFYIYQAAFRSFRMGFASALAWVLFIIIMALTVISFRSSASWVHYEGDAI